MNESEIFCTPVQTKSKRLGLRRNNDNSIRKEFKDSTPLTRSNAKKRTVIAEPQSDVKVSYRTLENPERINDGDSTPVAGTSTPTFQQRECVSTNCRPYRLSLSKRIRERMTKKRLEFHVANEMEKEEEEQKRILEEKRLERRNSQENNDQESENSSGLTPAFNNINKDNGSIPCSDLKPEEMSREQLLASIEELRKDLKVRQDHAQKVDELRRAIDTWKQGFASALKDLQAKITPHYENETLLEHLHIPKEMLKYVND